MRLLLLIVLLAIITPARADAPYFRFSTTSASETVTVPSPDQGLPPDMTNGYPGSTPPDAQGGIPGKTVPNSGLLEVSALPGWGWQIPWTAKPNLTQTEIYANGSATVVQMTVTLGRDGCARATVGFIATTGTVEFSTFRNDTNGPCMTPTMADWASAAGQPFPSSVKVVNASLLPPGNGGSATETGLTFTLTH